MGKVIGFAYDVKTDWAVQAGDPEDVNAEFDVQETVDFIVNAIESCGHTVKRIGNAYKLIKDIEKLDVDIVFNICEGYTGRNRESQVPVLLEMHGIPYIGSDALSLGLTLDKILAKKCFMSDGIPTPRFFEARRGDDLEMLNHIGFPLIVKCRHEGTSKGLTVQSRVTDYKSLKKQVELITQQYKQPALVEEFISGTEFTVAVIGNEKLQAMPVVQVSIDGSLNLGNEFYTFEMVSNDAVEYICPAKISNEVEAQLQELALKVYRSVDCRDFGRVDFRVDDDGNPYVLEINPLPSLAEKDIFNIFPQTMNSSFEKIIDQVINYGLDRYGLIAKPKMVTVSQ